MCEVTDEERAYEIGQTIGNYLAELGFNLDYAPVGDVLTNPENTVVKKDHSEMTVQKLLRCRKKYWMGCMRKMCME